MKKKVPFFKVQDIVKKHNVRYFSSNDDGDRWAERKNKKSGNRLTINF